MGFCLLTSGTSWDPASYNIKANTIIHVKCVGGGQGGPAMRNRTDGDHGANGSNGEDTTFGSITATGGGKGDITSIPGRNFGAVGIAPGLTITVFNGGDGWYPGFIRSYVNPIFNIKSFLTGNSVTGTTVSYTYSSGLGTNTTGVLDFLKPYSVSANGSPSSTTRTTLPYGTFGNMIKAISSTTLFVVGGGYGGGGQLAYQNDSGSGVPGRAPGSSGAVIDEEITLSSTSAISYTIGQGGLGGTDNYTSSSHSIGGVGAQGCIAIWW